MSSKNNLQSDEHPSIENTVCQYRAGMPKSYLPLGNGILIKDVKVIAVGKWRDATTLMEISYTAAALEKFSMNWADTTIWSKHTLGMGRSIVDNIGEYRNIHFADRAIVADVFLHGETAASIDTIHIVKRAFDSGKPIYNSAELTTSVEWNAKTQEYEADDITFTGGAIVNIGGCSLCTLNYEKPNAEIDTEKTHIETEGGIMGTEDGNSETKIESPAGTPVPDEKLIALAGRVDGVSNALAKQGATEAQLREQIVQLEGKLAGLEQRITKMENMPVPPATHGMEDEFVELELPQPLIWDKEGITMRTV